MGGQNSSPCGERWTKLAFVRRNVDKIGVRVEPLDKTGVRAELIFTRSGSPASLAGETPGAYAPPWSRAPHGLEFCPLFSALTALFDQTSARTRFLTTRFRTDSSFDHTCRPGSAVSDSCEARFCPPRPRQALVLSTHGGRNPCATAVRYLASHTGMPAAATKSPRPISYERSALQPARRW